jgi:hypothetical protein
MQRSAQSCRGVVDEGSVRGVGRRGRFSGTGAKNDWKMCEGPTVSRASEPNLSSAVLTQILASPTGAGSQERFLVRYHQHSYTCTYSVPSVPYPISFTCIGTVHSLHLQDYLNFT